MFFLWYLIHLEHIFVSHGNADSHGFAIHPFTRQSEMHTHTQYGTEHIPTERWGSLASAWQSHRFEFQTEFGSRPASSKDKQNALNLASALTCPRMTSHNIQCCLPKIRTSVGFYIA